MILKKRKRLSGWRMLLESTFEELVWINEQIWHIEDLYPGLIAI